MVGHCADRWDYSGRSGVRLGKAQPLRVPVYDHNRSAGGIIDPFAREFGVSTQSAFTLGYQPHVWSPAEDQWRMPALADLMLYEVNIAEFGSDLDRAREVVAYLADLGINAIEIMPLSNVGNSVDWGYLPIGYFGA